MTTRSSVVEDSSEVPSRKRIDPRNNSRSKIYRRLGSIPGLAAPSPPISARFTPVESPARWIQRGESVQVNGISIDAGMFYLGGTFIGSSSGRGDNCLVDPSCTVAPCGSDLVGDLLPYWPSIRTSLRLPGGPISTGLRVRKERPEARHWYVFLFF
ncbi:TerB N-terminal domain-containing protein [Mesorhizobium sp.]